MVSEPETKIFNPDDAMVRYMLRIRAEHAEKQKEDYSHVFRPKSMCDLIRLTCIVFGIELAFAAETAFSPPTLLQFGLEHQHMTMVWSLSPLFGFFFAPFLGSISDRCQMKLGRRRPLIIAYCLAIFIGLILIPHGSDVAALFGSQYSHDQILDSLNVTEQDLTNSLKPEQFSITRNMSVLPIIFVILGTIFIDLNVNTAQTACRAYILDVSIPTDHAKALSSFTVMAGLGGTIGFALGGIDWESTSIGSLFGGSVQTVFAIVTIWFIACFIVTTTSFREIPLGLIEQDELLKPLSSKAIKNEFERMSNEVSSPEALALLMEPVKSGEIVLAKEELVISASLNENSEKATADVEEKHPVSFGEYLINVIKMPKAMRILCLTNLLCWMADLCYCLYFTDFVGESVFHGNPTAEPNSEKAILYEEGVRFGCWGLSLYALSCALYSAIVEKLMKLLSTKIVYAGGILIFGLAMVTLAAWPTKSGVLLCSAAAGINYATLFTMPYIILARYHSQGCFKVKNGQNIEMKQPRGLGSDIAIISSMTFVAQLIISLGIGSIISLMGSTSAVMYAASVLSVAAVISALKVLYLE